MKTYFMKWYDGEFEEMTTLKINDKQKDLMDYLFEVLGLGDILDQADVTVNITESDSQMIDLT